MNVDDKRLGELIECYPTNAICGCKHCDVALALRELQSLRASLRWVEWKPGDALPARGNYITQMSDATEAGIAWPVPSCNGWSDYHVIAYLPFKLPTPPSVP